MNTYVSSFFCRVKSLLRGVTSNNAYLMRDVLQKITLLEVLVRLAEERSRTIEAQLDSMRILVNKLTPLEILVQLTEERSRTLEAQLDSVRILARASEERTQTLEYLTRQSLYATSYQVEQLQKFYVESMRVVLDLNQLATFNASRILELKTDFPVAVDSNDHINPDSTMEGLVRPTFFVQNCISVLGKEIKCLDLGTGAAGLIFEYAMSGVLAIGIDGSDFCRVNQVGFWPLLPNNLFTCDITKQFCFLSRDTQTPVAFDVITMWEVLEHIAERDLPSLFSNIRCHMGSNSYFIGSVSLVEYVDSAGKPYHVTLKPRDWWKARFLESGLIMLDTHPFDERLFCRGNGPRFQDFHNYALNQNDGFWFVAQRESVSGQEPV